MIMLGGSFKPIKYWKTFEKFTKYTYVIIFNQVANSTVQIICNINKKRYLSKWTGQQI